MKLMMYTIIFEMPENVINYTTILGIKLKLMRTLYYKV